MMAEYQKTTKEMVDLPEYVLCFLGVIMNKLEFYGLIDGKASKISEDAPTTLIVPIRSKKYKYCYDAIELIEKTLKRRGFTCRMTHYKPEEEKDDDGEVISLYSYEYKITKD